MSIVLIWVGLIFKIFPSKFSLRVAGVSVAEFITVRFQSGRAAGNARGALVSVAEFITVRFQRLRFHCEINDVVAWEVDLLSKLMELQKFMEFLRKFI